MARKSKTNSKRTLRVRRRAALNSKPVRWSLYLLTAALGLGVLGLALRKGTEIAGQVLLQLVGISAEGLNLEFSEESSETLSADEQRATLLAASKFLKSRDWVGPELLAEEIQRRFNYQAVRIFSGADRSVVLAIKQRRPVAVIQASGWRFVSDEGAVYGKVPEGFVDLPQLRDFVPIDITPMPGSGLLELSQDDTSSISSALSLLSQLGASEFGQILAVRRIMHRGFEVSLRNPEMQVVFGSPPYVQQIRRLSETVAKFGASRKHAERIELDYNGKVFVKFRDM